MSRHINELAEIVLGHVYQLGYQHRSDIGKHHETADELVAVQRKLRETEQELERLRRAHMETQHEELTEARATIADLRQQLDVALLSLTGERLNADKRDREIETLRKQLDAAQREASDEFAERQVLQHEASDDYVELERLRAFVEVMRGLLTEEYADQRIIAEALDELDAGTPEPVPVAEPLDPDTRDQELERLYSAIDGDLLAEGISHVCREIGEARKHGADSEPSPVAEPLDAEGGA